MGRPRMEASYATDVETHFPISHGILLHFVSKDFRHRLGLSRRDRKKQAMHSGNKQAGLCTRSGGYLLYQFEMIRIASVIDAHIAFSAWNVETMRICIILHLVCAKRRWLRTYHGSRVRVHHDHHPGLSADNV